MTASTPVTSRASVLTGNPAFLSRAKVADCLVAGQWLPSGAPSTSPTW